MACRLISIHIDNAHLDAVHKIREEDAIIDSWKSVDGKSHAVFGLLVHAEDVECITDKLQTIVKKGDGQSISVSSLDAVLPKELVDKAEDDQKEKRKNGTRISREELYEDVSINSRLSWTFVMLVVLSTVVAAIGLLENDVAVVIGAMVIAPLLGPNIALALGTALGDRDLSIQSIRANLAGVAICLTLAVFIGLVWPGKFDSEELLGRTSVSYDNIALAIAAGAAAALSLTTGISGVLVGVMVAVALLPPATAVGIMIGAGEYGLANGALLLLATNIACINFAAKLVFWAQGIRPRTWYTQKRAGEAMRNYLIFWALTLLLVAMFIYLRNTDIPVIGAAEAAL